MLTERVWLAVQVVADRGNSSGRHRRLRTERFPRSYSVVLLAVPRSCRFALRRWLDWMWPAIWLLPVNAAYGEWPASGEMCVGQCLLLLLSFVAPQLPRVGPLFCVLSLISLTHTNAHPPTHPPPQCAAT